MTTAPLPAPQSENGHQLESSSPAKATAVPSRAFSWSLPVRCVVSMLLVAHLSAVLVGPAAVQPSSPLFRALADRALPYLQAVNMDNGYHFFAPDPGGYAVLLGYRVIREDGSEVTGRIPNREIAPRLLYHRHFMLTERMLELGEDGPASYARHLCAKHNGVRVEITRIQHNVPRMESVLDGLELDDPGFYVEQPLGVFTREELLSK